MRNFGVMSGRPTLGGASDRPSAYSADTRADLDSPDFERGAFFFALLSLTCPFALTGFAITVWLLFFR